LWSSNRTPPVSDDALAVIRFNEAIDESVAEIVPAYLRRESRFRDRFLGMLGHDLRGPISAIQLTAALLAATGDRGADELRAVNRIVKSCERLDRMVKDIIDFTRGRLGEPMYINRAPVDLVTILRDIIEEVQCGEPNVEIDFAARGDLAGEWDSERLSQMIWNLVKNAIEHGKASRVAVSVANDNGQVLIEVHNDGLAIPQNVMASLFNPLGVQGSAASHRVGLGLGLFICNEIVKAHEGTITAVSTPEAGTTFTVHLNCRAGQPEKTIKRS
jgi:signal transduction histidine kinase